MKTAGDQGTDIGYQLFRIAVLDSQTDTLGKVN